MFLQTHFICSHLQLSQATHHVEISSKHVLSHAHYFVYDLTFILGDGGDAVNIL